MMTTTMMTAALGARACATTRLTHSCRAFMRAVTARPSARDAWSAPHLVSAAGAAHRLSVGASATVAATAAVTADVARMMAGAGGTASATASAMRASSMTIEKLTHAVNVIDTMLPCWQTQTHV